MLDVKCLQRPTTTTVVTTTVAPATYSSSFREELNWLEYQRGALHPLLKEYAEEADEISSAKALMGLNTSEFLAYLERMMAISYGLGAEYANDDDDDEEGPSPNRVICPPIPRQWVRGLPRKVLEWAGWTAYTNGMLDQ